MRFMVMVMATKESEAGAPPKMEDIVAMQAYNEELAKAGVLLAAEGLSPSSKGARLTFRHGKVTVVDGPFAETKELIAGFTIIQADSKDAAIEMVKRAPLARDGEVRVEIRKLMDLEDFGETFGEGFTPNEEVAKVKF